MAAVPLTLDRDQKVGFESIRQSIPPKLLKRVESDFYGADSQKKGGKSSASSVPDQISLTNDRKVEFPLETKSDNHDLGSQSDSKKISMGPWLHQMPLPAYSQPKDGIKQRPIVERSQTRQTFLVPSLEPIQDEYRRGFNVRCIGTTTHDVRCRLAVSSHSAQAFLDDLDKIQTSIESSIEISQLENLVTHALCPRYHQIQAKGIACRLQEEIKGIEYRD